MYEQFGFVDDGAARVMELERIVAPKETLSTVQVTTAGDLEELVAFDRVAFGACREKLLRVLWHQYRDRLLLARDASGGLAGYLFARDPTLGPWASMSCDAAEALLVEALRLPFMYPPHVLVPRSNDASYDLLAAYGFVEHRRLRHMRRGGSNSPGRPALLYGQSSFAHG